MVGKKRKYNYLDDLTKDRDIIINSFNPNINILDNKFKAELGERKKEALFSRLCYEIIEVEKMGKIGTQDASYLIVALGFANTSLLKENSIYEKVFDMAGSLEIPWQDSEFSTLKEYLNQYQQLEKILKENSND